MGNFRIRRAEAGDADTVAEFIRKKFDFDRALGVPLGPLQMSVTGLRTSMFGKPAFAHALLLEDDGGPRAFALYYFRFSSFAARPSLWLDDLYVDERHRRRGAGEHLMRQLARIAEQCSCTHLAWIADDRNSEGMHFYRKLGAELVDQQGRTVTWRITVAELLERTSRVRCVA
jgi:GNAT superfamily N-acetyltransferase